MLGKKNEWPYPYGRLILVLPFLELGKRFVDSLVLLGHSNIYHSSIQARGTCSYHDPPSRLLLPVRPRRPNPRWHSLPWENQPWKGMRSLYATLRLPSPLRVSRWVPPLEDGDTCAVGHALSGAKGRKESRLSEPGTFEEGKKNTEHSPSFVDAQILVTLQVRPGGIAVRSVLGLAASLYVSGTITAHPFCLCGLSICHFW